jgi:hypothetical protein
MKKKDPALWAACRLHRILSHVHRRTHAADPIPGLSALLEEQRAVKRSWGMYRKAQSRGWTHCTQVLLERLLSDIESVHAASRRAPSPKIPVIPTIADIFAEITHLVDDFEQVEILPKEKRIDVITDEITLEEVYLGRFSIQLHLDSLWRQRDATAFVILAQDPNSSSSDSSCTHPHVRDEAICAGDAAAPISHALAQGRIGDAFQLINRVLHTYNGSSAYVDLDDWDGRSCSDCGQVTSGDDLYLCDHCEQDYCDNCIRICNRCGESICLDCSESGEDGSRLCPSCKDEEDKTTEETAVSDDPAPELQPQTETTDEHSHTPDIIAQRHEHSSVTPGGEGRVITADVSPPQAA